MIKFDLLDKKILLLLINDSRIAYSDIAKITGVSTEKIFYRIKRLSDIGIVTGYKTVLNLKKIGYNEYNIYLKLMNFSKEIRTKVIEVLKENPYTLWVGTCVGEYDFRVYLVAKDTDHLKTILDGIENEIGPHLQKILVLYRYKKYNANNYEILNYLSKDKNVDELKNIPVTARYLEKKSVVIDTKDWQILRELSTNSRISYNEIGKILGVTGEDINYRFKKIMGSGMISRFSVSIDYQQFGLIWWNLLIKLSKKEDEKQLIEYVLQNSQTTNIIRLVSDDWDFEISFYSKDIKDADIYVTDVREKFMMDIKDVKLFIVNNTQKNPQVAKGIFDDMIKEGKK